MALNGAPWEDHFYWWSQAHRQTICCSSVNEVMLHWVHWWPLLSGCPLSLSYSLGLLITGWFPVQQLSVDAVRPVPVRRHTINRNEEIVQRDLRSMLWVLHSKEKKLASLPSSQLPKHCTITTTTSSSNKKSDNDYYIAANRASFFSNYSSIDIIFAQLRGCFEVIQNQYLIKKLYILPGNSNKLFLFTNPFV